ncbi:hypothetical protein ACXWTF_12905 [Thiomicrolovo sp. ZZH C-3]
MFRRSPPSAQTEQLPLGWFALSHRYVGDIKERRKMHGEWFRLKSKEGTIYRVLRFSPRLKGSERKEEGQLLIDWNGWLDLNGHDTKDDAIEIEIAKARPWEYFHLALSHPDPTYRHNSVLAIVGLALGAVSLVVSLI